MIFSIFDSTGNLVASYSDEAAARQALAGIVRDEPEAAGDVALLAFDDQGRAVGDAVHGTAVVETAAYADWSP